MKLFIQCLASLVLVTRTTAFLPRNPFSSVTKTFAVVNSLKRTQLQVATEVEPEVEPENFKFESNVSRVMDIIINSLYSNKDVFIRELVSFDLIVPLKL